MFKPQNKQEASTRSTRHKLEPVDRPPTLDDLRLMYGEADRLRGILVELTIRAAVPPVFILTCQYDQTAADPLWALYEGDDGSKVVWTYPGSNMEMIAEVLHMSLPQTNKTVAASIPTHLAPQPEPPAAAASGAAPSSPPTGQPGAPYQGYPQQPYPQPQPGYNAPAPGAPYPPNYPGYPQPPAPGQGYPQQNPYPPQTPYPPQQAYPPAGHPYPNSPPPGWGQPNPYGNQPPSPAQGNPYGAPQQQPFYPQPPAQTPSPPPSDAAQLKPVDMHGFIDILSKGQPNLLLGHLFVEAGMLPEPCVESALKIQELVRLGKLSNQGAVEALRRAAERGGVLDDATIAQCQHLYPSNTDAAPRTASAGIPTDPREAARQVILMIQSAGIVSENDISTAEGVRRKHGGDVGSILVAAGKIDRATLDAARGCQPLVRDCRLNMDEVARILRHCQKNRSSLEDACRELAIRVL